jgi:hypothetical protein
MLAWLRTVVIAVLMLMKIEQKGEADGYDLGARTPNITGSALEHRYMSFVT